VHGSNAKTHGLQYLQFPDMGAIGGPPEGVSVVHYGTDELLIQQNTIPDGEAASPVYERSQLSGAWTGRLLSSAPAGLPALPLVSRQSL
jgi:hypothetical protein